MCPVVSFECSLAEFLHILVTKFETTDQRYSDGREFIFIEQATKA